MWIVDVGWTSVRPIVPDQHWSRVAVEAPNHLAAELLAHDVVSCQDAAPWRARPRCVMVTSLITLV